MITRIHHYFSERRYILLAGIILATVITLGLTLLPVDNVLPQQIWTYDKVGHLIMFGGWTFLVGYYRYISTRGTVNLFLIFFIGVFFGIAVEGLQYILPLNRTADLFDIAFDALGCFIAILVLYRIEES